MASMVDRIMSDPATSHWLRNALRDALLRDPVDASNDADVLRDALEEALRIKARQGHFLRKGLES